ncbi:hypothetical protein GCM10010168_31230 [Actinoplanes ianthinogenes]|uniref:Uncharacterized protein n=1 Tax=Actinoplanes ianthinogenes TaxID=122358 RepID=A0ABM7LLZ5_9ACTN|nr:hypothetical protein [Actinoplanes ianthinogenes]BCJ40265.1 hypothetical protein Aiant_09220 [Actinoplanes ianthinogenes]GGR11263.1 hypothetical protein GCM10010168_31230 [Actinoplanes ianthinogenes]
MHVVFVRGSTGSAVATVHRADGVSLQLPGYDRKHKVPHDFAHYATERALEMSGGVFGAIAGGGVFADMRVVGGKPRHDAAARSKRLLDAHRETLSLAELLAGVVHRAVEDGSTEKTPAMVRDAWQSMGTGPFPWTDEHVEDAVRILTELTGEWEAQGTVRVTWPDHLTAPLPEQPGIKRGRRGRA